MAEPGNFMKGWLLDKKWRVVLGGILLVAVPILGLAFFVYFTMAQSLEALLVQTCRDNVADCVYAVTAKLDGDITIGKLFASRLLLHGEILKNDQPGLTSHLKTLLAISSSFERAIITSPQGILLADYPPDPEMPGQRFLLSGLVPRGFPAMDPQRLGRELQQANDAMQVHQQQLAESNDRLTVASKTKSDFLANM